MNQRLKHFLFAAVAAMGVVASIEVILGVARKASERIEILLYPDNKMWIAGELGFRRPNPNYPSHDAWGFRNPSVPENVHTVALGDSLTYGTMVDAEDTWPRQLERISNVSTYSMAFGGFAPTHELLLWEEAKQLDPEVVIVAMYAGNDLFDCFRLAYFGENLTEFRSSDPAVLEAIDGLKSDQSHSNLADHGEQYSPARAWVRKNSSLYGLLRALRDVVSDRSWRDDPGWEKAKVTARYPGNAAFESDDARTVFTVARRTLALDLEDVRIREGHRIALAALERLDRLTSEAGAKLLVLFLPTKEYVFSDRVFAKGGAPIVGFSKLVENERSMWADTTRFLTERSISHVDALSTLRRSFSDGRQPFRTDLDGHLNPYGNRQIAELVHRELQARGLVDPPRPEPAIGR